MRSRELWLKEVKFWLGKVNYCQLSHALGSAHAHAQHYTLGKRILRLSCSHSNASALIGLDWPSIRARVLIKKLCYLKRVLSSDNDKLSSEVLKFFASRDISTLTIVEQCRYLEGVYETDFTAEVLTTTVSKRELQKRILATDKEYRLKLYHTHQSLKHIIAAPSWLKIWDMALDHGARGTKAAVCFFSSLSRPLFGDRLCPHCNLSIPQDFSYLEHLVETHHELQLGTVNELTDMTISAAPSIIDLGKRFLSSSPHPS